VKFAASISRPSGLGAGDGRVRSNVDHTATSAIQVRHH
jgi:hypothetical protein